jgi:ABC-type uncharacterized transport system substrate-binding protein
MENELLNKIKSVELNDIIGQIAMHVHEQSVQIRKESEIPEGMLKIYSDCVYFPISDGSYQCIYYVVHVDNQSDRFFIVTSTSATEDEYLDSIDLSLI